ncbi:O-methyltransferase [Myxosarcina sp. GI1]|uniref:O-methyltransferase n=1 Tax=Myxosarcina sp. GI1 TaxID=1541065 RepID=UPI00056133B0|nr:O-methyltransferase [Myxosarcina sp. GI1]
MNPELFAEVDRYIGDLLAPQDDALSATIESLGREGIPQHSVSPNQGKMLQILALVCNAKNILEIGTLGGYSTIWLARALPDDGRLISLECDRHHAKVARKNIARSGLESKVEVRLGKALELLPQIEAEIKIPFDFVFIDADKPPYVEYFQWAVKLVRPGGLIVADNVIREGKILDRHSKDEKVLGVRRFNQMLASNIDVTASILQTIGIKGHDGMAIAVVNRK